MTARYTATEVTQYNKMTLQSYLQINMTRLFSEVQNNPNTLNPKFIVGSILVKEIKGN